MIEYYVLDTETTGQKTGFHEVNAISIMRVSDKSMIDYNIAVKYPYRAHPEALKIQQITTADLKKGQPLDEVVSLVSDFFALDGKKPEERCIIAHNASFDLRFCQSAWDSVGKKFPANLWLCTMKLARRYVKKTGNGEKIALAQKEPKVKFGLNNLLIGVGIEPKVGAHNAAVDVYNCLELYNWLMSTKTEYVSLIVNAPHDKPQDQQLNNDVDDL